MSRWERNLDMQYRNAQDNMSAMAILWILMFTSLTVVLLIYDYWAVSIICLGMTYYWCLKYKQHRENVEEMERHMRLR